MIYIYPRIGTYIPCYYHVFLRRRLIRGSYCPYLRSSLIEREDASLHAFESRRGTRALLFLITHQHASLPACARAPARISRRRRETYEIIRDVFSSMART